MSKELRPLLRVLGTTVGVAVCVGSAVGAGVLRAPGEVASILPDSTYLLAAWVLGAVVATLDSLILAEWAGTHPRVGGLTAYLHRAYGPAVAFLSGWSILLITWPGSIAAVAVATGEIVMEGAGTLSANSAPTDAARFAAVGVVVAIGLLNLLGLKFGARAEVVLSFVKVAMLVGLFAAAAAAWNGIDASRAPAVAAVPRSLETPGALLTAFGAAMVPILYTYDGYADAIYLAGETKEPHRAIPKAVLLSLGVITVLYLLTNGVLASTLGAARMAQSKFAALELVEGAFGPWGARALAAVACVVMVGAIHSYFLTGPRIARLLAEERLALPAFGQVNTKGTPVVATLWLMAIAGLLAFTNSFGSLLGYTIPIIWLTNLLIAAGLLVDRWRKPDAARPLRLPLAGLVVGGQLVIGALFFWTEVKNAHWSLVVDGAALVGGYGVYRAFAARGRTA
ncbi:MAG: amino acid permease [Planctomycetes bacterium]|nr:amino acid permease [Planctomycetota bacterium]